MLEIAKHAFAASAIRDLAATGVSCFICNFRDQVGYWPEMLGSFFGAGPLVLDPNYPRYNPNDRRWDIGAGNYDLLWNPPIHYGNQPLEVGSPVAGEDGWPPRSEVHDSWTNPQ